MLWTVFHELAALGKLDLESMGVVMQLTELERQAIDVALSGPDEWSRQLREQVKKLEVQDRKYTGFGFYTRFGCENCTPVVLPERLKYWHPGAWATHPDVQNGADGGVAFTLHIKDGILFQLEGASTTSWPVEESKIGNLTRDESED